MAEHVEVLRGQGEKPLLVHLGGWLLVVVSVPQLLFMGLMVTESVLDPVDMTFAALGIDGLSAPQLLALSPVLLLLASLHAVLGYGLLKARAWARPLGTLLWLGAGVVTGAARTIAGMGPESLYGPVVWGLLGTGAAFAYFYGRRDVREYFNRRQVHE